MTVRIKISPIEKLITISFMYLKFPAKDLAVKEKLGSGKLYKVHSHERQRQESFKIRFRNQVKVILRGG